MSDREYLKFLCQLPASPQLSPTQRKVLHYLGAWVFAIQCGGNWMFEHSLSWLAYRIRMHELVPESGRADYPEFLLDIFKDTDKVCCGLYIIEHQVDVDESSKFRFTRDPDNSKAVEEYLAKDNTPTGTMTTT